MDFTPFIQSTDNHLTLYIDGPLDYTTVGSYQVTLNSFYKGSPGITSTKISMKDCPYIDTAGIGFLVKVRKEAKEFQRTLTLVDVDPDVMEVFKIVNVVHWFEFK